MKLNEIVEQLKECNFECEGGSLVKNEAFIELKRMSVMAQIEINRPIEHLYLGTGGDPIARMYGETEYRIDGVKATREEVEKYCKDNDIDIPQHKTEEIIKLPNKLYKELLQIIKESASARVSK